MDENRRRDVRAPANIKIKFKCAGLEDFVERHALDVSRGGIFIRTKDPLPIGTSIRFQFQLEDASPLISGEGTVAWSRAADPQRGEKSGMGVRFDRLADSSQAVLDVILTEKARRPDAKLESRYDAGLRAAPKPVVESPAPVATVTPIASAKKASSTVVPAQRAPLPAIAPAPAAVEAASRPQFDDEITGLPAGGGDFATSEPTRRRELTSDEMQKLMRDTEAAKPQPAPAARAPAPVPALVPLSSVSVDVALDEPWVRPTRPRQNGVIEVRPPEPQRSPAPAPLPAPAPAPMPAPVVAAAPQSSVSQMTPLPAPAPPPVERSAPFPLPVAAPMAVATAVPMAAAELGTRGETTFRLLVNGLLIGLLVGLLLGVFFGSMGTYLALKDRLSSPVAAAPVAAAPVVAAPVAAAPAPAVRAKLVEVNSTPSGAEVLVDGQPAGRTPYTTRSLDWKTNHELQVKSAGYQPQSLQVRPSDSFKPRGDEEVLSLQVTLAPEARAEVAPAPAPRPAKRARSHSSGEAKPSPKADGDAAPEKKKIKLPSWMDGDSAGQ